MTTGRLSSGQKLSHYTIISCLGEGGMGVVYGARDDRLGREVAIKVLPTNGPLSESVRRRFEREAMTASALNHPNIVTIYEINQEEGMDFIVMEYVRGKPLSQVLCGQKLSVDEVVRHCIQIADALSKAHAAGIVHRDLKPGNIMVNSDGLVKVLDFGLAKFEASNEDKKGSSAEEPTLTEMLTGPGSVTGTLAYMSPEQARGEKVDTRSDIFSFAIVMFELLSGKTPFDGENLMSRLHNLHFSPPRDLNQLRPDVPKPLVALVGRMLEKKPDRRIQHVSEVATALRLFAAGQDIGPVTWEPTDASRIPTHVLRPPGAKQRINRSWNRWLAAVLTLLLIGGGIIGVLWWKRSATKKAAAAQVTATAQDAPVADNAYALYQHARNDLDHSDRPGSVDSAIKLLGRAVQLDPQSAVSYAALSEAYEHKNTFNPDPQWLKLASEYANQAVSLDNYLAAGHVSLGMVKMSSGDSTEAEKQFRTAADLDPKSAAPHRDLGLLYDKTGKADQAAEALKRALQLDPKDWKTYLAMGLDAYQAGRFKEAASAWEMALKLEPDNVPALRNLGAVYHSLGRDDDAIAALQRALEIKPASEVYTNLGTILFYQGKYDRAVPAFEKAVELGANNYDNWGNLGDAYRWSSNKKDKAKPAYENAIQLVREEISKNPNQTELRIDLAMYLAKSSDKDKALKEMKPVVEVHDTNPSDLYNSALVFELCGKRDQALDALLAAVKAGQDLDEIKNEPEFVSLRADPRYHLTILSAAGAKGTPH